LGPGFPEPIVRDLLWNNAARLFPEQAGVEVLSE